MSETTDLFVGFEVLAAVVKSYIFWEITMHSLVKVKCSRFNLLPPKYRPTFTVHGVIS
jgi:hypothetical protein